ncbi:MAG: 3-dehydroquinate synthase family protein [Coxiellaceae bacterium]|nr:3-dehydroquinate synthase family protein [Coxiellaceae bacterium]
MTTSFLIHDQLFTSQKNIFNKEKLVVNASQSSYVVESTSTAVLFESSIIVIDDKVFNLYKDKIAFSENKIFYIVATEENKTLETVSRLLVFFSQNNMTKSDEIVVIGGGVTQEIAAFACAIYKRGIAYHHFPTTLLSMCDSCIGGKTGLNFEAVKNQLGLFYPPRKVSIFADFIQTLPDAQVRSGLGEILKSCIIGGEHYLDVYQACVKNGKVESVDALNQLIFSALIVKKTIVEFDEYEKKYRAALNLGHTLGHAIEALFNYEIPHGLSVVIGMILENDIAYQLKYLSKKNRDFLNALCFSLIDEKIKSTIKKIVASELIPLLQKDKKTLEKNVVFVLLKKPGELVFRQLSLDAALVSYIDVALAEL